MFGLCFNVYNLSRLNSDYRSLANFNIHKSPQVFLSSSSLLKNLSQQIHEGDGRYTFKSSKIENRRFPQLF